MSRDEDMQDATGDEFAYDPDQDPEERRALRKSYRSLNQKAEDQRNNPNDYTALEIHQQVLKADELFKNVKGPQEATLDSGFLLTASSMGAQRARAMKAGSTAFDVDEFINKLVRFMGGSREEQLPDDESDADDLDDTPLDWDGLARKTLARSRRVPSMGFMLGPLSIEQKQRAQGKRMKYDKNKEDMTAPQELKEQDIQKSENETSKNVALLERLLGGITAKHEYINLFKFIINPTDFAQSVENMFHLSFLIRDGKVALDIVDEEPRIYLCSEPTDEDYAQGLKKQQIVFELDMPTWRRAIEVFEIKEAAIPQRPPYRGTKIGDKWYG